MDSQHYLGKEWKKKEKLISAEILTPSLQTELSVILKKK